MSIRVVPAENENKSLLEFRLTHEDGTTERFLTYRREDDPEGRRAVKRKLQNIELARATNRTQRMRSFV